MGQAQAFTVLAEHLNLLERPISEVRRILFTLVWQLGRYVVQQPAGKPGLEVEAEAFDVLNDLYQGLAQVEVEAMQRTHALNLSRYITDRAAEQAAEDEAAASSQA